MNFWKRGRSCLSPSFGKDDKILCKKNVIEIFSPVENYGKFTSKVLDLKGCAQVFDANDSMIMKLEEVVGLKLHAQYIHNYPHCWRTDTPLI